MTKVHNPDTAPPPFSRYAQGLEAAPGARWLHVSGQVGVDADGRLADGPEAQMEQVWRNILAILDAADMGAEDLVKITAYLTRHADVAIYREVRDRMLGGVETASTLVVVAGLAHPEWLVEIEAVAAKD